MEKFPIFTHLRQPRSFCLFAAVSLSMTAFNYYLMATLPGTRNYMCVMGANLTLQNSLFAILLSLMTGVMVAGIAALYQQKKVGQTVAATSVSGIGLFLGVFTVFCTLCTIPVLSLFGLSLGLHFFTDYNTAVKIISLLLVATGLFFLNQQLQKKCLWKCHFN